MTCRACGKAHSPMVRCEIAAAIANAGVANETVANKVVGEIYPRYRNKDARREYMAEYMRRWRRASAIIEEETDEDSDERSNTSSRGAASY